MNEETVTTPKTNGAPNGFSHPVYNATTPTVEEEDQFASLDHAATAPALAHVPTHTDHHPVEQVTTNIPTLGAKKSMNLFKKGGKEEKERKAAEKELEKQAIQKRKEMEIQRRENYRRQEEELRAVLAASKESAALEDKKRVNGENTDPSTDAKPANGASSKGVSGLSRFRHSSMSLRGKPKFWGGKDKDKTDSTDDAGHADGDDKGEEKEAKNRFSIGRKKSTFKF
jgi:ubiquitin carboxyl-terminal hydrolase 9/13